MKKNYFIKEFLFDNLGYIITYFINNILLITFFYLFYKKIEFIYPVTLSIIVFIGFISVKWYKYYVFNNQLNKICNELNTINHVILDSSIFNRKRLFHVFLRYLFIKSIDS